MCGSTDVRLLGLRVRILPGDAYLSLVSVVCYQVEVPVTGRSLVHSNPAKCVCVIEFDKVLQ